ncbi:MAG TPA: tetratricopeptide repeat protein [Gemmatimonadaceae bacterium]|nr:tetratricopeptide repeat protein [Gemmatimonadaceae bacterium]
MTASRERVKGRGANHLLFAWWAMLGIIALEIAAYASVWRSGFVRFDDPDYVTKNPDVLAGLSWRGVTWAFTTGHAANWHPATWLSHMADVQLFGLNPAPHHIANLLLHICNTVLLFLVLNRMTGAVWRSTFVAALFGLHPLHVESVAWIAERKDVLSTFFWMLTLVAYAGFVRQPKLRRHLLVVLFFALGLFSKPMVVTLPFVLLLLDFWPLERIRLSPAANSPAEHDGRASVMRLVREKLPLITLSAVVSVITVIVQRRGGAVGSATAYPLGLRVENAVMNYVAYLGKTFWPARLGAFYPYRESPSLAMVLAAAALLVAVTVATIRAARTRPYLLVGWLWYLGTLTPVIGIVQAGLQSMADRYTYIPLIGLFIMIAWGVADLARVWSIQRIAIPIVATALLACTVRTREQAATWRDSLSLWQNAVDVTSNNAYAQYNLAVVLVEAGRVDDGIARFRQALRIDPSYPDVHIDLGNALNQRGAVDEALAQFDTVVRLRPEYAEARVAYGNLLRGRGRNAEATAQYKEAVRLQPTLASAHNELGNALSSDGRFADARAEYAEAVRLDPNFPEAHNNLGAALAREGKSNEAVGEFLEALRLKPDDPRFHYNAALMLQAVGRSSEAVDHLQAVLRVDPGNEPARRALDRLAPGRSGG